MQSVQAAEQGDGDALGLEEARGHRHHFFFGNGFHALDDLVEAKEPLEVHLLPRQVRHTGHRALQGEQQIALQLVLCAPEFARLQGFCLEAAEFFHDEIDNLQRAIRRRSRIDAQRARIAIRSEIRVNCVDQPAFFANRLEEP